MSLSDCFQISIFEKMMQAVPSEFFETSGLTRCDFNILRAGAELCQAQFKLGLAE